MRNYMHQQLPAHKGDRIVVTLDQPADVRLLDDGNFRRLQRGEDHRYEGGLTTKLRRQFEVTADGPWHVIVSPANVWLTVNHLPRNRGVFHTVE